MHYYKRNIGDYHKKAGRLTLLQHGVYTVLMDAIYDREKFPTKQDALEWTWASTPEEVAAVDLVLSKFFTNGNGIYKQKRIEEELNAFRSRSETNKRIAIERETKRKKKSTKRARIDHESPPNHKPLTTNHNIKLTPNGVSPENKVSSKVPFTEIQNRWNAFADKHGLPNCVKMTTTIKGQIRQRWQQDMPSLDRWDNFFAFIGKSDFLSGRAPPGKDRSAPFRATLAWVTKESNFAKIAAREYS